MELSGGDLVLMRESAEDLFRRIASTAPAKSRTQPRTTALMKRALPVASGLGMEWERLLAGGCGQAR
jgi:hypothetical protein